MVRPLLLSVVDPDDRATYRPADPAAGSGGMAGRVRQPRSALQQVTLVPNVLPLVGIGGVGLHARDRQPLLGQIDIQLDEVALVFGYVFLGRRSRSPGTPGCTPRNRCTRRGRSIGSSGPRGRRVDRTDVDAVGVLALDAADSVTTCVIEQLLYVRLGTLAGTGVSAITKAGILADGRWSPLPFASARKGELHDHTTRSAVASGRCLMSSTVAQAAPLRIGGVDDYSTIPPVHDPVPHGLAIGGRGGRRGRSMLGRKVEVVSRDDAGRPDDAIRLATELVSNEKVALLAGTFLSNVGLAVAEFALRNKVLFVAAEPLTDAMVLRKRATATRSGCGPAPSCSRRCWWRRRHACQASAGRSSLRRLRSGAVSAVASFKALLKARRPDVDFVAEQWPALGKLEAASTVQALIAARPDAIFDVTLSRPSAPGARGRSARAVPAGSSHQPAFGPAGVPERAEGQTPKGWIVTGYP